MKDNSLNELGGAFSILTGVSYLVIAVIYQPLPLEQQQIVSLNTNPGAYRWVTCRYMKAEVRHE